MSNKSIMSAVMALVLVVFTTGLHAMDISEQPNVQELERLILNTRDQLITQEANGIPVPDWKMDALERALEGIRYEYELKYAYKYFDAVQKNINPFLK